MKRRNFLASGAGAAALALGPGAGARAASKVAGVRTQRAMRLSKAMFSALLNQQFVLRGRGPRATLVLVEVRESAPTPGRNLEQFSLRFDDPVGHVLEAGTHTLEHAELGTLALYLEPAESGPRGSSFRADFSLLA